METLQTTGMATSNFQIDFGFVPHVDYQMDLNLTFMTNIETRLLF